MQIPAESCAAAVAAATSTTGEQRQQTLQEFVQVRVKFAKNRDRVRTCGSVATMHPADAQEWHRRLYLSDTPQSLLKALPHLHQGVLIQLLEFHPGWMCESRMLLQQCKVVYFLLVALDPLMTAAETSTLRTLFRRLEEVRSAVMRQADVTAALTVNPLPRSAARDRRG